MWLLRDSEVLWVKNAPRLNIDDEEKVRKFIDGIISCNLPENDPELRELVEKLQTHTHSTKCAKRNKCRFNFPKPPSRYTLIANEDTTGEGIETHQLILQKAIKILERKDYSHEWTFNDFLEKLGVSENDYQNALSFTKRGRTVILERQPSEIWINNYNKDIS